MYLGVCNMFFSYRGFNINIRIKKHKLENKKTNQNIGHSISLRMQFYKKRASYTPSYKKAKASLTVEAAMAFPIFIFAFFLMIHSLKIVELQSKIQYALDVTSSEMAAYAMTKEGTEDSSVVKYVSDIVYSRPGASVLFLKNLKSCAADVDIVSGEWLGFYFTNSQIMKEDSIIYLEVNYKIKLPNLLGIKIEIPCVQNTYTRGFTGRRLKEQEEERIVYITTGQTVYHTNRSCTHLVLSIQQISEKVFLNKKKGYLKKYAKCLLCKNKESNGYIYITTQGEKYHYSLQCKSLKRTIKKILLKEVGSRTLCKRCSES